jgi:hypothetical protein
MFSRSTTASMRKTSLSGGQQGSLFAASLDTPLVAFQIIFP